MTLLLFHSGVTMSFTGLSWYRTPRPTNPEEGPWFSVFIHYPFREPPNGVCLVGMGDKFSQCFTSALPGSKRPNIAHSFGSADFEKCLTAPL